MTYLLAVHRATVFLLLAIAPAYARAQGGTIDATFGHGGRLALGLGSQIPISGRTVALTTDGRLVVTGLIGQDVGITVYGDDGTVDLLYGAGGRHRESLLGGTASAIHSDGVITLAGTLDEPGSAPLLAVVRLLPGGGRDPAFGADGMATVAVGTAMQRVFFVLPMDDGDILVFGWADAGTTDLIAIVRLDAGGELDPSFDGDGRLLLPGGPSVGAVTKDLQGRIIYALGGTHLTRLLPDGSFDASFGSGGHVTLPALTGQLAPRQIRVLPDGHILVICHQGYEEEDDHGAVLFRLRPDGTPDSTFGDAGRVTFDFGGPYDNVYTGAVTPDGRIIVAGERSRDIAVVRRLPDGSPDATFGAGGMFVLNLGAISESARDVVVLADGRLAVLAQVGIASNSPTALLALLPDGTLDPDFAGGGVLETQFVRPNAQVNAAVADDNDAIYAAGQVALADGADYDFVVVKLLPGGTRDPAFGDHGVALVDFDGGSDFAFAVARYPDGRVLAGGNAGAQGFGVARLHPDGTLDSTFGADGRVVVPVGTLGFSIARGIALYPDGRIVLSGECSYPTATYGLQLCLARLFSDGSLDPSFGTGGVVEVGVRVNPDRGRSVALLPDDRLIVAGQFSVPSLAQRMTAVRFLPDGTIDTDFGQGGYAFAPNAGGHAEAMVLMPDGRAVVAGGLHYSYPYALQFGFFRLNPDGSPDTSFDDDGVAYGGGSDDDKALAVTLLPDGRVGTAGYSQSRTGFDAEWAVHVRRPDGSADAGFGPNGGGSIALDFGAGFDVARAIVAQSNGRLVIAGGALVGGGTDAMLVGLHTGPATTSAPAPERAPAELVVAPNPVVGRADLRFVVEGQSTARVVVHDILGRLVAVLWDGPAAAGVNHVTFDARGLEPGVYVARLQAGTTSLSRRVTVAR